MCTCCQNTTGCGCRNRCGCFGWRSGCWSAYNACGTAYNSGCGTAYNSGCGTAYNNGCGNMCNGCATVYNGGNGRNAFCGATAANVSSASVSACNVSNVPSCARYMSFPVSGTAYVPTSAITFCPNLLTAQNGVGSTSTGGTGCGCFGRCGGAAAISNYFQDYYNRQYGLDD